MKHVSLLGLLLSILLAVSTALAQATDIPVDGKALVKIISKFASDEQQGRRSNTPEFNKLQDWVIAQYQKWGLQPAGEGGGYFQNVPINREYVVNYGIPELSIDDRPFFSRFNGFTIDARSAQDAEIEGRIVFAGYGISAPDKGLDEYAGIDVNGKIVFVLSGDPAEFTPPKPRLDRSEHKDEFDAGTLDWSVESTDSAKIMTAYQKGAAAIMLYNPEQEQQTWFNRFRQPMEKSPFDREFIIANRIDKEIFEWIFWTDPQMSARSFQTWIDQIRTDILHKKARTFATNREAEIRGFSKSLFLGSAFGDSTGRNILAKIPGVDQKLKDEYVVIGAHFDHVGMTDGQIFNGAEDNASGSAVVFELARLLKKHNVQPKRTIILCLWTAEELGLIGSRYWVAHPTDGVDMNRVVGYFNLDMVGIGDFIDAPGAMNFPEIFEIIKKDQAEEVMAAVKPREGGPGGSDQTPFIELGIEAMALMTHPNQGGHPDYHDTGDDVDKMNPVILEKTARFVLQGALNLANETETNLLLANRQDRYDALRYSLVIINPVLKAQDGWNQIEATNSQELAEAMTIEIKKLRDPDRKPDPYARWRRYRITPRRKGISGGAVFGFDRGYMEAAKAVLNFGRIDVEGDDGVWFDEGLTPEGLKALHHLEKEKILLHLIHPNKQTLATVLDSIGKPVLISGVTELDDALMAKIKSSQSVIAIDFDSTSLDKTIDQLETFKTKLDTTSNLILNISSLDGLDYATQSLYLKLIEKGWSKEQIYAIGGQGTSWRSQGNLDALPGGRTPYPGRR